LSQLGEVATLRRAEERGSALGLTAKRLGSGWGSDCMPEEPRQKAKTDSSWVRLTSIGFELAAAIAGFTLAGYWWDRHFGTSPWGTLTGVILGLVGGMYNLIRQSLLASRNMGSGTGTTKKKDDRT
jgi:F0F1-type ATP synthase assembly protein I